MQESESEAMPTMDMDIFILCLWFHSTKHYRTLMPQYIHFEQNPVLSLSASSLGYIHQGNGLEGEVGVAGRPTRGPDGSG